MSQPLTPESSPVAAAIVGTGFMGNVHAEALRRLRIPIAGILGSTPDKSRVAADSLGIDRAYDSFDALLADPHASVIHINTPNRHHFEMARRAIQAGKHVLCEKPLAMNSVESAELVRLANANPHLATGVNYNIRFYPLCIEAAARVADETVGKILHVTGSYVQDWLLYPTDYNWRVLAKEGGALRAVADIGTHWLDLVRSVTGLEIESVCADLQTVHSVRQRPKGEVQTFQNDQVHETESVEITTDDYGSILLRFQNGVRGSLHVSQVMAGRKNCLRFEIAGSKSSLAWNSEQPNELLIGHRNHPNECLLRDPSLMSPRAQQAADNPGGHNEGYADSFKQCFQSFYRSIQEPDHGLSDYPTFADGHREILICEAILASHKRRQWVDVAAG